MDAKVSSPGEDDAALRFGDIGRVPIGGAINAAFGNHESSPFPSRGGYSLEEKRRIVEDMDSTEKGAMDAMYRELMALSPKERESAIKFLAMNGQNDLEWWRNFLGTWEL